MKYVNGKERLNIKNKIKNTSLSLGVLTVIGVFNSEDDSKTLSLTLEEPIVDVSMVMGCVERLGP